MADKNTFEGTTTVGITCKDGKTHLKVPLLSVLPVKMVLYLQAKEEQVWETLLLTK